jgi:hypothetical protein
VSHGEDIWAIFVNAGRDHKQLPYSQLELAVSDNLVDMYYNFASKNVAMYEFLEFEACKPNDVKVMEIFSHTDYRITTIDEHFGNVLFWDEVESTLNTPERTFYDEL